MSTSNTVETQLTNIDMNPLCVYRNVQGGFYMKIREDFL